MNTKTINRLLGITESYQAPKVLMDKLMGDVSERQNLFKEFLIIEHRLDYDWFHEYFQDEHADRKTKKQDFTPNSVSRLLAELTGTEEGNNLDVAAGTGGITIQKWYADRINSNPFDYQPSHYFYQCEELSDRSIPFLLFNLMIRGMNATVLHGDSLTREVKQIYFVQNDDDDFMKFSSLNIFPHDEQVSKIFDVNQWLEVPVQHIESELFPNYLKGRT